MANGRIVGVLPSARINGVKNVIPTAPISVPVRIDRKKLVDANLLALSRSLFPSFLDMILPAPCPNINPKACRMAIRLNTTPTAPLALVPKRLTKYVSAVL